MSEKRAVPTTAKYEDLASTHPRYAAFFADWRKCRDFLSGIKALRAHDLACWDGALATVIPKTSAQRSSREPARGSDFVSKLTSCYIPPLSNRMTYTEYVLYLFRGHYYNIVEITLSGYLGQLFGHPAKVEVPAAFRAVLDDFDLSETPILEFTEIIAKEVLAVGRCGVLVDRPMSTKSRTVKEAEANGIHPYGALYKAEDVLDWKSERMGARNVLTYIKLREHARVNGKDDFIFRELRLDADGYYQVEWTRADKKSDYTPKIITPNFANETRIDTIPFYPFSPRGGGIEIEASPIINLVDMAHEHYQAKVEYASARFAAAIPTPGFYGFSDDEVDDIILGGQNAFYSSNPEAHAEFLQTGADGLQPLRDALKDVEDSAAKMGSRALVTEKAGAEAAATVRIRKSGETVTLADVANSVSRIMAQMLTFSTAWNNTPGEVVFQLPTEYDDWVFDASDFATIYKAYQAGDFPRTDYIRLLRKRRFIDTDRTDAMVEEELEAAAEQKEEAAASALASTAARLKEQGGAA